MTNLPLLQPALRTFFLGPRTVGPASVQISKVGGPFVPALNPLVAMSSGWYSLALTSGELDQLGPLAYLINGFTLNNQPQDIVVPTFNGQVDQAALNAAMQDLSQGFALNEGLGDLLKRPLYLFLISLRPRP